MKKILIFVGFVFLTLTIHAQQKKKATQKKARSTQTTKKKTTTKKAVTKKTATYTTPSIKGLEKEREAIKKKISQQEKALRANQADVKKRLQDLLIINSEIDQRKKSIDEIQKDITHINGNIDILNSQLTTLQQQLDDRKAKYVKSMQYMSRNRSVQENLMFIFSAKNLGQMYRRLRFVREYASYQKAQGELLKTKQNQVNDKHQQLENVKGEKNNLLYKDKKEHAALQNKQGEQEKMVAGLQKQQKTIQAIIDEQKKKDAALNAQIDRLIAIEVEKARKRAEEEARKKAEAAAAAKRRAEELARKKAEAEAAAREAAKRIAAAKAREEKMREEARLAAEATEKAKREQAVAEQKKAAERQARADQAAREAEAARRAAERKAEVDRTRAEKDIAEARKDVEDAQKFSTVDRMLSGGFEANKGRLPMPITGNYRIVSHFGQYNVEGLKGVKLDNKGINIMGSAGCQARSIYDGEVSAVFGYNGTMVVMVRHGSYISVYCNLQSVNVSKGQKVSTRQTLGTVGQENILQFQLRKETAKLNPEVWLGR